MPWLTVPHLKQAKTGWCLPACVGMVTAYLQQPLLQDDIARWLGTDDLVGTPSSRVRRLSQQGFNVTYEQPIILLNSGLFQLQETGMGGHPPHPPAYRLFLSRV